jgi:hypothetical protein
MGRSEIGSSGFCGRLLALGLGEFGELFSAFLTFLSRIRVVPAAVVASFHICGFVIGNNIQDTNIAKK